MALLQLGLITMISHSLQVSGLDSAGTTTRFNSKTICQITVGLLPLLPPQFVTVQYDRGWTRMLLAKFIWGFVGFFGSVPIFSQRKIRAALVPALPLKGLLLRPEKHFVVFRRNTWIA